jgi:hypothetical protein
MRYLSRFFMTCAKDYSEKINLNLSLIVIQIIKNFFYRCRHRLTCSNPEHRWLIQSLM